MIKKKKGMSLALALTEQELKKEHYFKIFMGVLLFVFIVTSSFLFVFISTKLIMTGYSNYVEASAGSITKINLTRKFPAEYWLGLYGLALRVSGFTELLFNDFDSGEITRQDVFFDCVDKDALGGPEVYASTLNTIDFDNLIPATAAQADNVSGCSGKHECAVNTFTENMSIMVGTTNISGIPSTHTLRYDGNQTIFDMGILYDTTNDVLVYVTHIGDVQRSYNYDKIVNYQMLIPAPVNSTQTLYFFTDPYDECPAGSGIGELMDVNVYGFVFDLNGDPISNVSVNVGGISTTTNSSGAYNISFSAIEGTYNLIAQKQGYQTAFENVTFTYSITNVQKNLTLSPATIGGNETVLSNVDGYITDESGIAISDANVSISGVSTLTNSVGYYSLYPVLTPGTHPIVAFKEGYNNNYSFLEFTNTTFYLNYNLTLSEVAEITEYLYETGPYSSGPYTSPPGIQQQRIKIIQKEGEDYWISTKEINKEVRQNTFIEDSIGFYNFKTSSMNLVFSLSPELKDFIKLDKNSLRINGRSFSELVFTVYGTKPLGSYNGTLSISGGINVDIPVNIKIVEKRFPIETLLMEIDLLKKVVSPGENLKYKLNLQNLLRDQGYLVDLDISVTKPNGTEIYVKDFDQVEIKNILTLLKQIKIPKNISEGDYLLNVEAKYLNYYSSSTAPFVISKPVYLYTILGIPLWIIVSIISFLSFIFLNFFLYKRHQEKKKRYRIELDLSTLPKAGGERVVRIGNIAETKIPAYYELERLTTHCIVAGATGMGKSISAQVIIEEALMNNVAVIVFDPTAQWSGMLRKCVDKRMLSFYPKFGLKETDARGFKGNVREVLNSKEVIDIQKYINPGQIQILTLNKLEPQEIDFFVASVIRQIFNSDPKESPTLKVLLVFDEVHRLLSKFGGSGEGFLQVERACREFRKWGLGVMLISQVLSDFVGEIKANINTEVQTRTIEEKDLERIKTKYGDQFLKSLVKAEVGVAMFQNAEYNRGRPYFINFRPILHNTRRLSDEELEKYNKYNNIVDDLEYQINELEKEKVDIFDLKMELKLVKDKIMTGSFSVVEIYLEGLKPRVEKAWEKLGKKPPKREIKLVNESEVKKAVEEAKAERAKVEAEEAKKENKNKKPEPLKKENLDEKVVSPLTFDNGIMVSSLKELKDVLPDLDEEIFKLHVNENKNDIAKWISENFPGKGGEKIKTVLDKPGLIKALTNFGKEKTIKKSSAKKNVQKPAQKNIDEKS